MVAPAGVTPTLDRGEVQVWIVPTSGGRAVAARLASQLSRDERERAARMTDSDAFVIGRAGVRAVLARFTSVPPGALEIVAGRGSRPRLVQGPDWLDFSFTRCAEVHVCALTMGRRIGVDVQAESSTVTLSVAVAMQGQIAAGATATFCTPAERHRLTRCAPEERSRVLASFLTQKDALSKAVGAALAPPPDTIETPGGDETGQAGIGGFGRLALRGSLDRDDWHAATFEPVAGVIGAVVAEGEWTMTFATWSDATQ